MHILDSGLGVAGRRRIGGDCGCGDLIGGGLSGLLVVAGSGDGSRMVLLNLGGDLGRARRLAAIADQGIGRPKRAQDRKGIE